MVGERKLTFLSTFYVLDAIPEVSHLVLLTLLVGSDFYHHFAEEET